MSPVRTPMTPPALPGYRPVRLLGSGGYSDVFLYEQEMPRRQVAIKVLVASGLGEAGRRQFYDEANAMASVSTHPYIVTVFDAQVSSSGHPYLVMEFYPRPNFSARARSERIPVAEVLRTGVLVASAVETAHRAGILHRDIKPANILTSEYNRPGLTDFGIATSATEGAEAEGMSVPWSPPEILNATAIGDETSDVYSLAATLYTLLSGRSPFEVPGESNRHLDLIRRIDRGDPLPTGREDVPESVERLLRHGMSRSPVDRPESAQRFARMLQSVELELGLAPTQLEIREEPGDIRGRVVESDEDGTRLKSPKVIQSQQVAPPSNPAPVSGVPVSHDATVARTDGGGQEDSTVHRGSTVHRPTGLISGVGTRPVGLSGSAAPRPVSPMPSGLGAGAEVVGGVSPDTSLLAAGPPQDQGRRTPTVAIVKVAWAILAVVAALVVSMLVVKAGSQQEPGDDDPTTTTNTLPDGGLSHAPTPKSVSLTVDGSGGVVTWEHPGEDPADYTYTIVDAASGRVIGEAKGVTSTSVPDPPRCVRVVATPTAGGSSSVEQTDENTNC